MFLKYYLVLYIIFGINCNENFYENSSTVQSFDDNNLSSRVLSRTKRFLIFPDGSSLQLVFCCQTAALIPIGDIFLYGNTAALSWNLPTDSKLLLMFKNYEKTINRRGDEKNIYYVDRDGKILGKASYTKRPIVNPAFAKRSVDEITTSRTNILDRVKMHEEHSNRNLFNNEHLDNDSIQFHRKNRLDVYKKIATVITALGGDGRQCVLHKLCETARISRQGAFLEELLRVVFTLPKGKEFDEENHKDFNKSHSAKDNCDALYPECSIKL